MLGCSYAPCDRRRENVDLPELSTTGSSSAFPSYSGSLYCYHCLISLLSTGTRQPLRLCRCRCVCVRDTEIVPPGSHTVCCHMWHWPHSEHRSDGLSSGAGTVPISGVSLGARPVARPLSIPWLLRQTLHWRLR